MSALITNKEILDRLAREISEYSKYYVSSDPGSIVLFAEAFGFNFMKENAEKYLLSLARTLRGLIVRQNPLYGYYLPYLYVLGLKVKPELARASYETALDLVEYLKSSNYDRLNEWISKSRTLRKETKRFLVSTALSAKYLVELSEQPEWRELAKLYSGLFESIVQRVKTSKIDLITLTALLVLHEHINEVRRKVGLMGYEHPQGASWAILREKISNAEEVVKASIAALLYDLFISPYSSADARHSFLQVLSSILLNKLSIELAEKAKESEEAEFYTEFYQNTLVPILGLDEVEYALLARFLRILREEYISVPICAFSEFVKRYYHVPESLLKIALYATCIKLRLYRMILKLKIFLVRYGTETLISILSSFIFSYSPLGNLFKDFLGKLFKDPMTSIVAFVTIFVITFFVSTSMNITKKLILGKLRERITCTKNKMEKVTKELEEEQLKLKYFKLYIGFIHRNHGLS